MVATIGTIIVVTVAEELAVALLTIVLVVETLLIDVAEAYKTLTQQTLFKGARTY